jgi:hypothetical protein
MVMMVEGTRDTWGARSQLTTRLDHKVSGEELDKNASNFAAYHTCALEHSSSGVVGEQHLS